MNVAKKIGLIGVLSSTIIGAGIFSLPYIFNEVGALNGVLFLVFFAVIYIVIHSMYATLVVKNPGMEFGSIAKKYLGSFGGVIQWLMVGELLLVCFAYLVLAPEFFLILFGGNYWVYVFIFWILGVFGMSLSMKGIEISQTIGLFAIFGLVSMVGIYGFFFGAPHSLNKEIVSMSQFFLPFGPLLFAFSGRPSIRKIVEALDQNEKKKIYSIIVWGTIIPAVIYGIYALGMLRMYKVGDGVIGTILNFPWIILSVLAVLGILVLWTSYFIIGMNIRDILVYDVHIKKSIAFFIASCVPLLLFFLGIKNFIEIIGFIGGVFLAFEGILIVLMWCKQAKKNIYFFVSILIFLVFCIALIQEVILFI